MSWKKKLLAALLAGVSVFGTAACSGNDEAGDGAGEKTGEEVDEGVEKAGDGLEKGGDKAENATNQ